MKIPFFQTQKASKHLTFRMKYWILILGLILLLGRILLHHTQLHFCLTPSLDGIHVLLFQKITPIKRGDIVAIRGHDYKHLGIQPYAKRVIGFAGELIIKEKYSIKVGERLLPLMEKTREGQPLTPIMSTVVPEGYLFVAGDHPRSIDSRYEEFGFVPVEKVWGKAILAW